MNILKFLRYPLKKKIEIIYNKITSIIFFPPSIYFGRYLLSYLPDSFVMKKYTSIKSKLPLQFNISKSHSNIKPNHAI